MCNSTVNLQGIMCFFLLLFQVRIHRAPRKNQKCKVSLDLLSVYKPSWFGCLVCSEGGSEYLFPVCQTVFDTVMSLGNEEGDRALA